MSQAWTWNGIWLASMQSLQVTSAIKNQQSAIINQISLHATDATRDILDWTQVEALEIRQRANCLTRYIKGNRASYG